MEEYELLEKIMEVAKEALWDVSIYCPERVKEILVYNERKKFREFLKTIDDVEMYSFEELLEKYKELYIPREITWYKIYYDPDEYDFVINANGLKILFDLRYNGDFYYEDFRVSCNNRFSGFTALEVAEIYKNAELLLQEIIKNDEEISKIIETIY